jgi:Ca2+-transporting ATPase
MNALPRARILTRKFLRTAWSVVWRACVKFDETDAEQRAASFAYYAFFALFPLIVLLILVTTYFLGDQGRATAEITGYIGRYIPQVEAGEYARIIQTVESVVHSRKSAGVIAFAVLAWTALHFFKAMVRGVNRAWGTKEYSWWRLPIKNLFMAAILASALLIGIVAPMVLRQIEAIYWESSRQLGVTFWFASDLFNFARFLVPPLVLFYGFLMFYKFAPRRRTLFREVWIASLFVTLGVDALQRLFTLYARNVTNFNLLYGSFGSIVALLLWIYLIGSIIIFGACLSAAEYEVRMSLADQSEPAFARYARSDSRR